jgi:hypothetical protein
MEKRIDPLDLMGYVESLPASAVTPSLRAELTAIVHQSEVKESDEKPAPRVVQCHNLVTADFVGAPDNCVIVKTGKASNFRVERHSPGVFIVYGRTEFMGGSRTAFGIEAVRELLATR